jgi:hypothetical protein
MLMTPSHLPLLGPGCADCSYLSERLFETVAPALL